LIRTKKFCDDDLKRCCTKNSYAVTQRPFWKRNVWYVYYYWTAARNKIHSTTILLNLPFINSLIHSPKNQHTKSTLTIFLNTHKKLVMTCHNYTNFVGLVSSYCSHCHSRQILHLSSTHPSLFHNKKIKLNILLWIRTGKKKKKRRLRIKGGHV